MSRFKVVITDTDWPDHELEEAEFCASGMSVDLVHLDARRPEQIMPHAADADALMVQFAPVNREVIASLRRCRVISRYGIGVDMIDVQAATERGIMVANVPDYCIEEVSTATLAFLLCLNRRVIPQDRAVRAGSWAYPPQEALPVRLSRQVLGIVGLGQIGRAVAVKALALQLRVLAYDPYIDVSRVATLPVALVGLEELLRTSDYVTLHCPLTEETRHLIGAAELAMMKPTAYLINMSRGPVVDQNALYEALARHRIAGAALDVLAQEPPSPDEPLLRLDNVILSPHSASLSDESVQELRRETARSVVDVLKGGYPRSVINSRALGLNACARER
ncbi:MAG: C-terminal binding protein [Anaerolineae bacterium]|nr:C-terminal binding protein [Anaerolineae bacterium]